MTPPTPDRRSSRPRRLSARRTLRGWSPVWALALLFALVLIILVLFPPPPPTRPHRVVTFGAPGERCETQADLLFGPLSAGYRSSVRIQNVKPEPLFPDGPPRLARYCVIDYRASKPPDEGLLQAFTKADAARGARRTASRDRQVLMPQGLSPDYDWEQALEAFWGRAGRLADLAFSREVDEPRLVVVDTFPTSATAFDPKQGPQSADEVHGYLVASILHDLTCLPGRSDPDERCFAEVYTQRGLGVSARFLPDAQITRGRPPSKAGGPQSDLARAIYEAVRRHASEKRPLVLNLSVGWSPIPDVGGDRRRIEDDELAAPAAVYDAIRFAGCMGAVVVAAAGNNLGGPGGDHDGRAVYPAAWAEQASSITAEDCSELGMRPAVDLDQAPYLLAAGGAHDRGSVLSLSRFGSASVMAVGSPGLAFDPTLGEAKDAFRVLHGTSVATAVVTGAVAVQWALDPGRSRGSVFQQLLSSGPRVTGSEEVAFDQRPLPLVRVCEVAKRLCATRGGCGARCFPETELPPIPTTTTSTGPFPGGRTYECAYSTTTVDVRGSGKTGCWNSMSVDERPQVNEQPGDDYCALCRLDCAPDIDLLELVLQPVPGTGYTPKWLVLDQGGSGFPEVYAIGDLLQGLPPGSGPVTLGLDGPSCPPSARIIWEGPTGDTTASEVPVQGL